jgi:NAD(P)-dependent dehydrogenase (short-subunit alcohol dehydrogenase family)
MLLEHKKAVIYGAGGAIGGAVARAFAHEGADLFLYSRTLLKVFSLTMSTERRPARQLGEGLDRVTHGIASSTRRLREAYQDRPNSAISHDTPIR